jgi:FkbM family methyltransferase
VLHADPDPQANDFGSLCAVQAAVSDRASRLTFYRPDSAHLGNTTTIVALSVVPNSSFETDARPLPALLTDHELTIARIVKIDVERAEAAAITGLAPQLHRLQPAAELAIEVSPRLLRMQATASTTSWKPCSPAASTPTCWPTATGPAAIPARFSSPARPTGSARPAAALKDPSDLVFSRTDADYLPWRSQRVVEESGRPDVLEAPS